LAAAIPEYEAAYRAQPHFLVQLYLAQAYSGLGRPVEALEALDHYDELSAADSAPGRRELARSLRDSNRKKVGTLVVAPVLAGLDLRIDGAPVVLDASGAVPVAAGEHWVTATLGDMQPLLRSLTIRPQERTQWSLAFEPRTGGGRRGMLDISCRVPGASVFVDDVHVGTTPLSEPLPTAVGVRVVRFERTGYVIQRVSVPVAAEAVSRAACVAVLSPVESGASSGLLEFAPHPLGLRVRVDGDPWQPGLRLPSGPHRVELERDGYRPWSATVDVGAGERRVVPVELEATAEHRAREERRRTRLRRWSTVTGLGGLGLAAAGSGVLLANTREYDDWRRERDAFAREIASGSAGDDSAARLDETNSSAGRLWRRDDVGVALIGGGVALLTTAIVLRLQARVDDPR
jgi:hypothetical protein